MWLRTTEGDCSHNILEIADHEQHRALVGDDFRSSYRKFAYSIARRPERFVSDIEKVKTLKAKLYECTPCH